MKKTTTLQTLHKLAKKVGITVDQPKNAGPVGPRKCGLCGAMLRCENLGLVCAACRPKLILISMALGGRRVDRISGRVLRRTTGLVFIGMYRLYGKKKIIGEVMLPSSVGEAKERDR
jgi:hypothetical protein